MDEQALAQNAAGFVERAGPVKQRHPDFDQVVSQPVFTPAMQEAIFESEQGPEVAYFLATNKGEADRIAGLDAPRMLREIGRLEGRFSSPGGRHISEAPPPITPLAGTAGAPEKDPENMTTAEWMAWNRQQDIAKMNRRR